MRKRVSVAALAVAVTAAVASVASDPEDEKTFTKPRWFDNRLDWCFDWGRECGQPAADYFCQRRRYTGARAFEADPNIGPSEPTRIIATNQVCNENACTGFKYITCHGPIPMERVFQNPAWKEYRLDLCLLWARSCGKPAADAYCRTEGFTSAFFYVADSEQGSVPTRLIGTDQICENAGCTGFQMIICNGERPYRRPARRVR